jgi:hypothetical protein
MYIICTLSNKNPSFVLFADDTSVIINELCLTNFESNLNIVFRTINMWLNCKLLSLNLNEKYCVQFVTKNNSSSNINIEHDNTDWFCKVLWYDSR